MEIEYRLDGQADAPLLVLSNSLGTTLDLWQPQMALFSAHFRVLRYNQRGHGGTPLSAAPLTLEILGRDVIALLDRLEVERAHFCGISMGGLTGLWLNRYQPQRLRRLVVANSAACIGSVEGWRQRAQQARRDGLAEIAAASPARWFSEEFRRREPQQVATLIARLAQGNAAGYAACCDALALADLRAEVARMPQPMLAIAGELDPVTTPDDARFLQENAPQAELTTLPASHIANIACPTLFAHRVLDFLTEV